MTTRHHGKQVLNLQQHQWSLCRLSKIAFINWHRQTTRKCSFATLHYVIALRKKQRKSRSVVVDGGAATSNRQSLQFVSLCQRQLHCVASRVRTASQMSLRCHDTVEGYYAQVSSALQEAASTRGSSVVTTSDSRVLTRSKGPNSGNEIHFARLHF